MEEIIIKTEHLIIHIASENEMKDFIRKQTDEVLTNAYNEMLDGALNNKEKCGFVNSNLYGNEGPTFYKIK